MPTEFQRQLLIQLFRKTAEYIEGIQDFGNQSKSIYTELGWVVYFNLEFVEVEAMAQDHILNLIFPHNSVQGWLREHSPEYKTFHKGARLKARKAAMTEYLRLWAWHIAEELERNGS